MSSRVAVIIGIQLTLACCLGLACATTTRYRVLSFFFDGVPDPASLQPQDEDGTSDASKPEAVEELEEFVEVDSQPQVVVNAIRPHPPYQQFRCGTCHASDSGLVEQTPQEGLCKQCHGNVPGDLRFVHGPVAVSDCLFCHHHHGGQFPNMLRASAVDICTQCHDRDDLSEEIHLNDVSQKSCLDCHSGHGGSDRFFLKQQLP